MTNSWAIEVRNKGGFTIFGRRAVTAEEIADAVTSMLSTDGTGGIVIYRSTVAESNECETDEEEQRPGNLEMVASGNYEEDGFATPSVLSAYERGEPPFVPEGGCETCGCPPEKMPMVNRGTGWCCEKHRKEQV